MVRSRVEKTVARLRKELSAALATESPPGDVAASFAVGVFVTALPTLGSGLVVLAVIAYLIERANAIALFAAVVVLNPVVKWGVYATSVSIGVAILGPVPGLELTSPSVTAGPAVATRLLVGNLLLTILFTAVGYAGALAFARRFCRAHDLSEVDEEQTTVAAQHLPWADD